MAAWNSLMDAMDRLHPASAVDILALAVLIYMALLLLKDTTAMSLLRGIAIMVVAAIVLVQLLDLTVLRFVLRNSLPALIIAVPIVFQPEIRRFLERLGRTGRWRFPGRPQYDQVVDVVTDACLEMAQMHQGALIVIERETGLEDYIDTGTKIDAVPTLRLLTTIFHTGSALHDGAVILRDNRVMAAGCTLPLSDRQEREHPGLRHRAALGVSERTDAIAVVVSEETGGISVAANGRTISRLDGPRLRAILRGLLLPPTELEEAGIRTENPSWFRR